MMDQESIGRLPDPLAQEAPGHKQAYVGVDPIIEEFLHAPYDPLFGARAMGRVTGQAAMKNWDGRTRLLAYMFALALLSIGVLGFIYAISLSSAFSTSTGDRLMEALRILIFPAPLGFAGGILLYRLLRE